MADFLPVGELAVGGEEHKKTANRYQSLVAGELWPPSIGMLPKLNAPKDTRIEASFLVRNDKANENHRSFLAHCATPRFQSGKKLCPQERIRPRSS